MSLRIAAASLVFVFPCAGQTTSAPTDAPIELEELTVSANALEKRSSLGAASLQPVQTVTAEELKRNAQATLGESIGWEPGVSSGYFGPGASRPVVRGFEGVRVKVLRDDLGTFDLSDISPDHGVVLEPFLLESVEIHRGPASLLYGNSAIGGAINTRSRVIAREKPDRLFSGGWESRFDTQGSGTAAAGHLSITGGPFVFQFTGSDRESDDISIPGRARSNAYEFLENPRVYDPTTATTLPVPNPDGTLPNSASEAGSWSAGVSWLPTNLPLMLGVSYSRFDTLYGVPYSYAGDPTDLYGNYELDLGQDRFDLESRVEFDSGFISKIEGRLGYASYDHAENFNGLGKDLGRDFQDTGLQKDAAEGRLDFHHSAFEERLTGVFGIAASWEDVQSSRVIFPPPDLQRVGGRLEGREIGIYLLEKYRIEDWTAQLGYRLGEVQTLDRSLESSGFTQGEEGLSQSVSGAINWSRDAVGPLDRLSVTGILSQIERQPTSIERYAFWNNAGIGRFLVGGDLDGTPLSAEKSLGLEFGLEAVRGPFTANLNGYHYNFSNFVFLQEAPGLTGGFGRAVQYIEREAEFTGYEAELEWRIMDKLTLSLMSDYVHAVNTSDSEAIPRMPPLRIGTRLEWKDESITAGLEIRHATAQERVKGPPRPELPTDAYTLVNADISWQLPLKSQQLTLFMRATNLLNEEARVSNSFRKDVAPLPGRGLSLGISHAF
jgi:iron complex outermembrane recepter protein